MPEGAREKKLRFPFVQPDSLQTFGTVNVEQHQPVAIKNAVHPLIRRLFDMLILRQDKTELTRRVDDELACEETLGILDDRWVAVVEVIRCHIPMSLSILHTYVLLRCKPTTETPGRRRAGPFVSPVIKPGGVMNRHQLR